MVAIKTKESLEKCCKECGLNTVRVCSVCGREYSGLSRDHLRTETHKMYKNLFRSLRDIPEQEVKKLVATYVVQGEPVKQQMKQEPVKAKQPVKKPAPKQDSDSDSDSDSPKKPPKKSLKSKNNKKA
jgi:hypothetical protein